MNAFLPLLAAAAGHEEHEAPNPLAHVVDHGIIVTDSGFWLLSNHVVMLIVAAILCLLVFIPIAAKYRGDSSLIPTGTRNFFEAIIVFLRNDVAKPLLGARTDAYMPLIWTLFFFIWFCNILGLLPIDVFTGGLLKLNGGHGIFGTATANIYVTGVLALITYCVVQYTGIKSNGLGGHLKHFAGPAGLPWFVVPVMIPVEIIGMLVKPFALAVRLFANMTAGHTLLAVLVMFVTLITGAYHSYLYTGALAIPIIIASTAIMVLELFVATLQAYLFAFLTALFVSQMLPHHDHDHDSHDHQHTTGNDSWAAHVANTPGPVALPAPQRTGPAH